MSYEYGSFGVGTVFKIKPDGTGYAEILDFNETNGSYPFGSLYYDGIYLYGMTNQGGANGGGTIFKIKPDGTGYVDLFDFVDSPGNYPRGSLISDGTYLYGLTSQGGLYSDGVIFKIKPDGTNYTKLLDFNDASGGGGYPKGSLFYDGTFLYGMTNAGGTNGVGTIFKIKPDGTNFVYLMSFSNATGSYPVYGSLYSDGIYLYGMTNEGGASGVGTLFKIKPDGTDFVDLFDFNETIGGEPFGSLISDGTFLYGISNSGNLNNAGTVFKFCISHPTVTVSSATICAGEGTATLTASGANTYTWSNGIVGDSIIVMPSVTTNYTVTGTDGNGCTGFDTTTIVVNPIPIITIHESSLSLCIGNGVVGVDTLIASGANTYSWSTGATTATITPSPTITTTYTVTGTGTNGCVSTDTVRIKVDSLPKVKTQLTSTFTPICSGDSIILSQSGANTYTWTSTTYTFTSKDSVLNGVKFTPKVGTDTFNLKGRDSATGCVNTTTISIVVKQSPNILVTPPPRTICPGDTASFTASGGAGVISYTWSPTTNLSPSANSTTIIVTPTVSTYYQVTGTDTNGCKGSNDAVVIIPQDSIHVNSAVICLSNSVTLNASSIPMTYTWSPATGLSSISGSSVIASPRNTTLYTISGTDAFGCMGSTSATVKVDSLPIISISKTPTVTCSGQPAVLMASGAHTYTWSTGTVAVTNTVSPKTNTEYTVVGTDTNGCSNTATEILLVNPLPPVAINGGLTSVILHSGQSINLVASGALTYSWTSGNVSCDSCASNTETPVSSTQYCVVGNDINGCRDSVCLHVEVKNVCDVFIPDAFSPNGDGENDEFKVYGHCITALTLQVFDRWGNQVFNGSGLSAAWDGSYGGKLMNTGSYVYQVQYTLSTGEKTKTSGNFSLMR